MLRGYHWDSMLWILSHDQQLPEATYKERPAGCLAATANKPQARYPSYAIHSLQATQLTSYTAYTSYIAYKPHSLLSKLGGNWPREQVLFPFPVQRNGSISVSGPDKWFYFRFRSREMVLFPFPVQRAGSVSGPKNRFWYTWSENLFRLE